MSPVVAKVMMTFESFVNGEVTPERYDTGTSKYCGWSRCVFIIAKITKFNVFASSVILAWPLIVEEESSIVCKNECILDKKRSSSCIIRLVADDNVPLFNRK